MSNEPDATGAAPTPATPSPAKAEAPSGGSRPESVVVRPYPKIIFFYVTFLPQFVSASDPFAVHKLAFLGLFFVVISVPPMVMLIFMAHSVTETLRRKPGISRVIDWLFASVFAGFAVRILLTEDR